VNHFRRLGICFVADMRVLVVLPNPIEADSIRERCGAYLAEGHDLAVCYVLGSPTNLEAALKTQQRITGELRRAFSASAEMIPVFVVSGGDGDGIDDCARAWDATDVKP
jgi:hypothetical protein